MYLVLALLSAFFAGVVSILSKIGMKDIDSDVGTFLRTIVVLIFTWIMVFVSNQYNNCTVDIGNLKSGKYYLMLVDKTKPYPWDEEFSTKFNQDMKVFETLFSKDNFEELKTSIVKDNYIYYKYHYKEITLEPNQSYDISYDFTKQN